MGPRRCGCVVSVVVGGAGSVVVVVGAGSPGGPCGPGSPCGPGGPGSPCGPAGPASPGSPFGPGAPGAPLAPLAPGRPCTPGAPGCPGSPCWPCAPSRPGKPGGPAGPGMNVGTSESSSRVSSRAFCLSVISLIWLPTSCKRGSEEDCNCCVSRSICVCCEAITASFAAMERCSCSASLSERR